MTRHQNQDETLDRALRDADPAQRLTMDSARAARADDALARILADDCVTSAMPASTTGAAATSAAPRGASAANAASPRAGRERDAIGGGIIGSLGRHRWAALAGAAAVTLGAVALGSTTFLANEPAHAEWNAAPQPVDPEEAEAAGDDCVNGWSDPSETGDDPMDVHVVERRGDGYMVIAGNQEMERTCISFRVEHPDEPTPSVWYEQPVDHATDPSPSELGRDQISEPWSTQVTFQHEVSVRTGDGQTENAATTAQGHVGSDVVGVTATTPDGVEVTATVREGRYFLWWPDAAGDPPPVRDLDLTFSLELADGTVIEDAVPVRLPDAAGASDGATDGAADPSDAGGASDGGEG